MGKTPEDYKETLTAIIDEYDRASHAARTAQETGDGDYLEAVEQRQAAADHLVKIVALMILEKEVADGAMA